MTQEEAEKEDVGDDDNGTEQRFMGLTSLIWTPVDTTITPPIPPSQSTNGYQVDSQYYWCYDYDHVLKIVNTALAEGMDKLKADALLNPAIYPPDLCLGMSHLIPQHYTPEQIYLIQQINQPP